MKVALLGDTHFGCRGDSNIFFEHQMKFFHECFFPFLEEKGIMNVIQAGDFFDRRKFINFRTLHETRVQIVEEFEKRGINLYIIPGNHDESLRNSSQINSLNEIFKGRYEYVHIMDEIGMEEYFDNIIVGFLPWINKENQEQALKYIKTCSSDVLIGHLELKGFEYLPGITAENGMDSKLFSHIPLVISGHYHTPSRKNNIQYLGTPYQLMWSDYNDKKGFWILDTEDLSLQFIENPYTLYAKIFYDERKEISKEEIESVKGKYVKIFIIHKEDDYQFQKFVERVNEMNPISTAIYQTEDEDNDESNVSIESFETKGSLEIIKEKVNEIDDDSIDKDKLNSLTEEIYREAEDKKNS